MIAMAESSADSSRFDDEVRQRWGATSAYQESQERLAGYSTEDRHHAQVDQEEALQGVIEAMDQGLPPTSLEAMVAADKCRQVISRWYFECSQEMHQQLASMYVSDERFREFYESRREGLAQYFHDAIHAHAG